MDEFVLAGDLGGTNLRVAAVDAGGQVLYRFESSTPRHTDDSMIADAASELCQRCIDRAGGRPLAFGFAIPAIMDAANSRIFSSPNLPELNGTDLARSLTERLGIETVLENDANSAAIGEFWLGSSRGLDGSICITLGTGVGGGLIIDSRLHRGPDGTAGEVGHICVEPEGHPCGCGSRGCLEQYSSASAVARMARELLPDYPGSAIGRIEELSASILYEHGMGGDELSIEVFRRAGVYLGIAVAGLINVLNPEAVVIGGGGANGWELFIGSTRSEITKRAFREPAERARIVRALLGNDAGIVGAAYLAFAKAGRFTPI